ncbi:MAG: hypothetical protein RMJ51_00750 [Candidatus Calescibacterium sp.]|nr:hypothetical protein [Candidatus Calescibacterium sp.]MCX7972642.1 hypothetical protein [bacterium]MDW8194761.1 hypothetical protein [Candidatus Calescibacterium sp.]
MKKNTLINTIIFVVGLLVFFFSFSKASFKIVPNGIPDFFIPKLKKYNYHLASLPPGKYTLIVLYSNQQIQKKSQILQNKRIEIGIFPDLRYISSNSINMYRLFSDIPERGKTKIFESKFITNTNPVTFDPLPFSLFFSLSSSEDSVVYSSNVDHRYIMVFRHKEKEEYLGFFDIDFDNNFSDLIILLNYISQCSSGSGGRGENKGNTPF